jgi:hypothetical protein
VLEGPSIRLTVFIIDSDILPITSPVLRDRYQLRFQHLASADHGIVRRAALMSLSILTTRFLVSTAILFI